MSQKSNLKTIAVAYPVASYRTNDIVWTIALVVASVILPAIFAHTPYNQLITGTIVNALLFIAVWRIGLINAILLAALPSSVALMRGLLPPAMAAFIPFIIFSNVVLVAFSYFFPRKYPLAGIIAASVAKFAFLFALTAFIFHSASPFVAMLQWPQLITALAGGLISLAAIRFFPKKS